MLAPLGNGEVQLAFEKRGRYQAAAVRRPQGVEGVISLRGPGQINFDASVFKTFSLAEKFKALFRAEAGMTRKALADKVGVNPQTIGFLERGDYNPSLELALNVAAVFEVPVELMFSFRPFPSVAATLLGQGDSA